MLLCEQPTAEQVGDKLMALIPEIDSIPEAKPKRLDAPKQPSEVPGK